MNHHDHAHARLREGEDFAPRLLIPPVAAHASCEVRDDDGDTDDAGAMERVAFGAEAFRPGGFEDTDAGWEAGQLARLAADAAIETDSIESGALVAALGITDHVRPESAIAGRIVAPADEVIIAGRVKAGAISFPPASPSDPWPYRACFDPRLGHAILNQITGTPFGSHASREAAESAAAMLNAGRADLNRKIVSRGLPSTLDTPREDDGRGGVGEVPEGGKAESRAVEPAWTAEMEAARYSEPGDPMPWLPGDVVGLGPNAEPIEAHAPRRDQSSDSHSTVAPQYLMALSVFAGIALAWAAVELAWYLVAG